MIQIPIYNQAGEQTGSFDFDETLFGGDVRPVLLKQAYVRYHANRRQGSAKTKKRAEVHGSSKKLYRQKGTGNARAGDKRSNIRRGGGHGHSKKPRSFRKDMPIKMRRLANRNALLAKAVDNEIRLVEGFGFEAPSTKAFAGLLAGLKVDRNCLFALSDTRGVEARSARNMSDVTTTHIDRLNVFELLNHRYLVADRAAFEAYVQRVTAGVKPVSAEDVKATNTKAEKEDK